jgi:hypothetical protein
MAKLNELPVDLAEHAPFTLDKYDNVDLTDREAVAPSNANIQSVQPPSAAQQKPISPDPIFVQKLAEAKAGTSKTDYLNSKNDDANKFNAANDNLDINSFSQLAKSQDPIVAQAAKAKMEVLSKNAPFANHLVNLDPTKPEDKLKLVQTYNTLNSREEAQAKGWTTIADNPQIGSALVQFLMGDKQGAVKSILGGNMNQFTEFDDSGKMLVVNKNELGQIGSIFDIAEKRMITMEEYAARGGSRALEDTMYRINQKENAKLYREAFAKDTESQNKSYPALIEAGNMSSQMKELAKNFKDLNPEQQQLLAGFTSGTLGYKQNLNTLTNLLDSASKTKGEKFDAGTGNAIAAGLGSLAGMIVTYGEDNKFHTAAGESLTLNGVKQKLEQMSHSANIEKNVNQQRQDLAKQMRLAAEKGDTDPETLKKYAALDQYFTLAKDREALYGKIKDKTPAFLALPTDLSKIEDQASRMQLSGLQGEYTAAQMAGYMDFREQMLKKEREYNTNFIPEPGRYEAAWVKQKEYAKIRDDFRQKTRDILSETPTIGSTKSNAPTSQITPAEAASASKAKTKDIESPSDALDKSLTMKNQSKSSAVPPASGNDIVDVGTIKSGPNKGKTVVKRRDGTQEIR